MTKPRSTFWKARLVVIVAQAPFIAYMQLYEQKWLIPYLVWMSFLTWLSAELPSG